MIINNKRYLKVLAGLMCIDTSMTIYCVSIGGIELNPLCYDFHIFIVMKILLSLIGITIIYFCLLNHKYTKPLLIFLLMWYGVACVSNLFQYIRWCIT